MSKVRKFLLAISTCVMAVATTLAVAVNFILPVKKGVAETVNVTVDFEENQGSFVCKAGTKWSVSDGVYKATNWGRMYYDSAISTTATRVISFDTYLTQDAQPSFTLVNASVIATTTTLQDQKSGVGMAFANTTNNMWLNSCPSSYNSGWMASKAWDLTQYYGKTSRVEITIVNKNVTFAIDGKVIFAPAEINTALSSNGIALEDTVYFAFCGNGGKAVGSYIDNLTVRDSVAGIPKISSFEKLDKLGGLHGGYDTAQIQWDTDIKALNGKMLRSVLKNVQAGNNGRGYDLTGMDYLSFAVDNKTGNQVKFLVDMTEGSNVDIDGNPVNNYGRVWSAAQGMPYYLEYESGVIEGGMIETKQLNRGTMAVPVAFKGRLVIPTTSFETVSWSANKDKNLLFSDDANAMSLGYMKWLDVYYFNDNTPAEDGSLIISDPEIYGDYIPAVGNSLNRVLNAIDNIGVVTAASESQIAFARKWYDALDDKTGVTNYATLEEAETAFAKLKDTSAVIGLDGKDFTGTDGVAFADTFEEAPSTVSAWIRVDRNVADGTHVGTVVGTAGRKGSDVMDASNTFSMEITTNGYPKFEWRVSSTAKSVFVVENVDVRTGSWLYIAFVRDQQNGVIACYINGVKVAQQSASVSGIGNISMLKPVMIGSDYTNDEIIALGYTPDFNGSIADVRVYSSVLTAAEIALDASGEIQDGLLGGVNFISGEKGEYYNVAGENATDAFGWQEVASVSDLKTGAYTLAVIPDTQMLFSKAVDSSGKTLYDNGYNVQDNAFYQTTEWLANNKDALGLQFVMHVGDLTDSLNYDSWATKGAAELSYALQGFDALTEAGVPWSISRGNHDSGHTADRLAYWDNGFADVAYNGVTYSSTGYSGAVYGEGSARIAALQNSGAISAFGSMTAENMRNTYYTFQTGDISWLVLALDLEPTDEIIEWANGVVETYSDHRVIVTTHAYMKANGDFMTNVMSSDGLSHNSGQELWTEFVSKHENIVAVFSGHSSGEDVIRRKLVGENGNVVWNFMIDASNHEYCGAQQTGVFALLGISEDGSEMTVQYYSAVTNKRFGHYNQFTVALGEKVEAETEESFPTETDNTIYLMAKHTAYANYGINANRDGTYNGVWDNGGLALFISSDVIYFRKQWVPQSVSLDVDVNGVFKYDADSFLKAPTDTDRISLAAFVTRASDGLTRKVFPAADYGAEFYTAEERTFMLSDIGSIPVSAGDRITLTYYCSSDNGTWRGAKFDGTVYDSTGTNAVKAYKIGIAYQGNTDSTDIKGLYDAGYNGLMADGTASSGKNYNGWSIGYWTYTGGATAFYNYTVTVVDETNATLFTAKAGAQVQLPTLNREGYQFLGYEIGAAAYAAGENITLSGNTTVVAKFEKIDNVKILDTDGNVALVKEHGFVGALPTLTRSGHVFLGYLVDGALYKAGYEYTGEETSVQAVFMQFTTVNGASMRLTDPSGIRFTSMMDNDILTLLGKENVTFGTLIAHSTDLLTGGAVDYDKLTLDAAFTKLNIVSTVQSVVGDKLAFNGALVKIKESHLDWEFVGRAYLTVMYEDGTTETFYSTLSDNARSLAEIAERAYNDRRLVATAEYVYKTADGDYSCYTATELEYIQKYFA